MSNGLRSVSGRRDRVGDFVADAHDWIRNRAAITSRSRRAHRFARFGPGSVICFPHAALFGEAAIRIGSDVMIGPNVSLSAGMGPGQSLLSDRIVVLGDRCVIGRNSSINGHLSVELGDDVYFGPNVYVTDQNHTAVDPTLPIGRQAAPERPVRIGAGSWIGTNAVVLPGVTIGERAIVGAGAVVTRDVPARAVAVGAPARVVPGAERAPGADTAGGQVANPPAAAPAEHCAVYDPVRPNFGMSTTR